MSIFSKLFARKDNSSVEPEITIRAKATPARCLSAFSVSVADETTIANPRIEGIHFDVACSCGSKQFEVKGYPMQSPSYPDKNIFASPISLCCNDCGKADSLFDPRKDGYDAGIDSNTGVNGGGVADDFRCSKCESNTFEPLVSLEYAVEDDEMENWEELALRPQDFFTWFSLSGKCCKCGETTEVMDYECA